MVLTIPLSFCLATLGCGPVEVGDGSDRSIQVVLEETGYAPFG